MSDSVLDLASSAGESQSGELNIGDVVDGKYRIERELGAGGMGRVVLAMHLGLEERVALKILLPEAMRDGEAVTRFAREAKAAARIKSEHVARVLDVSTLDSGMPYIVMEYLEGSDLEQIVDASGALSPDDAVDYVLQACEALAEAHARGVVHRDLKPGNLHLSRRADGTPMVKILDFGISKISTRDNGGSMTTTSALLGSPLYMSPEQMKATRDVDARSDIWAIGVVLYELLTGRSPFNAPSMPQVCARVLDTPPDSLASAGLPTELEQVILKCLQKKASDRYQDVAALAHALLPFAPERSEISIERIRRVIAGPSSSGEFAPATGEAFFPRAAMASAPTLSETDLKMRYVRNTMPMPAKVGGETMTGATVSAHNFLLRRTHRVNATYGAGALATVIALLFVARAYSHPSAPANAAGSAAGSEPSAPVVVVASTATAMPTQGALPAAAPSTSSTSIATIGTSSASTAAGTTSTAATTSASPAAGAVHGRKKAQELSKIFGGRE